MASKQILEKLFSIAKHSLYFAEFKENDIWKSCLEYRDRSDREINQAIVNIQTQDQQIKIKHAQKATQIAIRKKNLHIAEESQQKQDLTRAEKLLKTIFNNQ